MNFIKILLIIMLSVPSIVNAEVLDKENMMKREKELFSKATAAYQQGDYRSSIEYSQKSLAIVEKVFGKEHLHTAASYDNLGLLYATMGDYPKALNYHQKALSIFEKVLGKEDDAVALTYTGLGFVYKAIGDYPKALEYSQKALTIFKKTLGKEHVQTAKGYSNLGWLYSTMGDYPKALEHYQKALASTEKVFGKEHAQTASGYNNLGAYYHTMGDYPKALEYFHKALLVFEKVFGKEHYTIATSYNNLSIIYAAMGDYPKELSYGQKALLIREKIFGKEHIQTAASYSSLGVYYETMGNYTKAFEYNLKALVIREKVLGKEHDATSVSYNNLGSLYSTMGDYPKALDYYQKALMIKEKVFGEKHTDTAQSYDNLGSLYKTTGEYSKALNYYQKALTIFEEILGEEHSDTARSYKNLGWLHQTIEDYPKAHHYAQLAFDIFLKNRDQVFTVLDSKQKEKYLKTTIGYITLLLESSNKYLSKLNKEKKSIKAQKLLQSGSNAWLNYKGGVFDSENTISMLYISTKDAVMKVKIKDLVNRKRYLAKLYQSFPKPEERDRWEKSIKDTEAKIATLTNQIASKASNFKEQQGLKSITYRDITTHLKNDELYIDYARTKENYYLFSLDNKKNISFIQIDKNSTKKIDSLVKAFRKDITEILNNNKITEEELKTLTESSKEKLSKLYELVLNKPLTEQLKTKNSLIISLDGALRLLPFEALYDKINSKYLIEKKEIRYIPSGKELVRLYKYSKGKSAKRRSVIFANPNFNTKIASVSKEQIAITPNTRRSGIIKSLFRMRFAPLPGTKEEARAIIATLDQNSILEYQKEKASESNLMKVKEPKILHLATHGFFINDNSIPNPMLKSGIALAGANASAIKGKSDGIVTALKLSGLDLKGTDLVVLSACETGVVDINETDSVSGLSKAFIQAGAKDIVMSLWSVDDQATKELMSSFYQEMKKNKNYANALKSAKMKMIEEGRHPFYWAAFVVSGL